jgi:ferredoxin-NADP reductase
MEDAMQKPSIHLNGTSAEALAKGYEDAAQAVWTAVKALEEAAPNGRDYYPQGPDAMMQATKEHLVRLDSMRKVYDELQDLYEHCEERIKRFT